MLSGHPLLDAADRLPHAAVEFDFDGVGPAVLGQIYERLLDSEQRRETGSHFTPPLLASQLVDLAVHDWITDGDITVCDPAVGGGAFLLAAAEAMEHRGLSRPEIVGSRLFGSDVSAEALLVADAALTLWAGGTRPDAGFVHGDSVRERLWDTEFDLVIGNPPFLNQLASATARSRGDSAALQDRFGEAAIGYVDSAALFLLASLELVAPRGRLLMIQPQSTLAAEDASAVRRAVQDAGSLRAVWLGGRDVFAADVEVCALLVEMGDVAPSAPIRVLKGSRLEPAGVHPPTALAGAPTWSVLLAAASGVPAVDLPESPTLSEMCTATAGFRDQFYGLAAHTHELDDHPRGPSLPRLTTVGMIDPARSRWGTASFRFNHERWRQPVLDVESVNDADQALGAWVEARLEPKVCVATQTRVVEAAVDVAGTWVPATPVVAVHAAPADLWLVAAVLLAPPVSAWAMRGHAGAALSADALRLSARQLLNVPLPSDRSAWEAGAACVSAATDAAESGDREGWRASLVALGGHMCRAYGLADEPLMAWWEPRLPGFR